MTSVLGLRLAYRGFVTGLAAGYAWLAVAMACAALVNGDPLEPLRPLASLIRPAGGDSTAVAFVLGFGLVQLASATVGMCFAYFFGRFFTARATMAAAAPCFAILTWALFAVGAGERTGDATIGLALAPILATLAYGVMLGAGLPLRGEVLRPSEPANATPAA